MSAEVDWVLATIKANWAAGAWADVPLERIDRDNSELLEGDIRSRKEDLQRSNYVGAALADRATSPLGFEYDHEVEAVVGVRVEGLHADQWGHVDPDGALPPTADDDGVPFDALVREIRKTLLRDRTYPQTNTPDTDHYTVLVTNESPDSAAFRDYYRYDLDVILRGDEKLP
ncbi:hypothetical protein [Salinilacihabitans rarus]|uniref:hypothetical protein n=1 Tax=Salinilacihabitans rarus TaxID=2961596 RepID=UPI0020C84ACC|nr:hypothetical protein [Salinilacihabitans rarus]